MTKQPDEEPKSSSTTNNNNNNATLATISETFSFAWKCGFKTRLLFIGGTIGGIAHGLAFPAVAFFLSQSLETISKISANANKDDNDGESATTLEASFDDIRKISFTFLLLGVYSLATAFFQTACFELLSYKATGVFQKEWFHALLRQDAAFYDIYTSGNTNNTITSTTTASNNDDKKNSKKKDKKQKGNATKTTSTTNTATTTKATISASSINHYQQGIGRKFGELIQSITTATAGIALGLYASWKVALLVFAILPFVVLTSLTVKQMNQTKTARAVECYEEAGNVTYSTIASLKTILSLNAIRSQIHKYQTATQHAFQSATQNLVGLGLLNQGILASIVFLFMGVVLFGSLVMYREIRENGCSPSGGEDACSNTGAEIFSCMLGIVFAGEGLSNVGNCLESFTNARLAAAAALRVISRIKGSPAKTFYKQDKIVDHSSTSVDTTTEGAADVEEGGNNSQLPTTTARSNNNSKGDVSAILPEYNIDPFSDDGIKLETVRGELTFDNITFAYPTRPTVPILKNFSLTIPAGKTVALVGPSGGGKSTVLALIERFYDPLEGSVSLDGTDIRKLNLSHYRSSLGYVGQEPALFATTIKENISNGSKRKVTQEEIEQAARFANAHDDFIISLPDGYETQVGNNQLSGGQKQRIALARTLVAQPKILCLDEATSALDAESELHVQHALDTMLEQGSRTAVIVAHRLSTIRNADLVFVIAGGGVVESGSHEELMKSEAGHYRNLVEKQEIVTPKEGEKAVTTAKLLDTQGSSDHLSVADNLEVEVSAGSFAAGAKEPLLEFRDVNFSYPARPNQTILQKFNLSVMPGETLALVGPSGGGKSTTVGLIERFYDANDGAISFNGYDIKTLQPNWYRDQIGYVGQEPSLFPGSVADNIKFGAPNATQEMIEDAAKEANIHDFVMSLPDKYRTQVGTTAQLSGGQKQRIAIARALIKKPSFLLLDEASSALDRDSEAIVQKALTKLMKSPDHTVIVIAHKLSSICDCADRIAVVGHGRVLEIGSHNELVAKERGHYKRLLEAQKRNTSLESLETPGTLAEDAEEEDEPNDPSSVEKSALAKDGDTTNLTAEKSLAQRARKMATPDLVFLAIGSIGAIMVGATYPVLGLLFAETINLFFFRVEPCSDEGMSSNSALEFDCTDYWDDAADNMQFQSFEIALYFVMLVVNGLIGGALMYWGFGQASERLSKRVRDDTFTALVRQEVGFFDCCNHGELKSQLEESTARLQAFSGAPVRTFFMAVSSILIGITLSFFFMWPYALICIACMVPIVYSQKLRSKSLAGEDAGGEKHTSSGAIAMETLLNMRTIAALGLEGEKMEAFEAAVNDNQTNAAFLSAFAGFMSGIGMLIQRWVNAALYFWGGYLLITYPENFEFNGFLVAQFSFLFSSFGLGSALQDIEDRAEVEASTKWIFSILDRQSLIDPLSDEGKKLN